MVKLSRSGSPLGAAMVETAEKLPTIPVRACEDVIEDLIVDTEVAITVFGDSDNVRALPDLLQASVVARLPPLRQTDRHPAPDLLGPTLTSIARRPPSPPRKPSPSSKSSPPSFSSTVSPIPDTNPLRQQHSIPATAPPAGFSARVEMTVNTRTSAITELSVPRLDPAAKGDMGAFIQGIVDSRGSSGMSNNVSVLMWAMGEWVRLATARARVWAVLEGEPPLALMISTVNTTWYCPLG
ncbi:hypothetical protein QBC39DRAFT_396485 [Podospora conica]|nr:hypothetical protein QBC39DRAFT_396485 [Schizothecium conicum]